MSFKDLSSFCAYLKKENELVEIKQQVDSNLEIAQIHRSIAASNGPALLFSNVKNSPFPVVTNLFGSEKRMALAFPSGLDKWLEQIVHLIQSPPSLKTLFSHRKLFYPLLKLGSRKVLNAKVLECKMKSPDLDQLPLLKLWPEDGGHFLTLPLVYTSFEKSVNLGMYRMQRFSKNEMGLHFQIGKGGGFHYHKHEELQKPMPISVFLGGPPALILASVCPLPENISEILFASLLLQDKINQTSIKTHPHPLFSDAEFAILGVAQPNKRKMEGPFGDHYGYYSLKHPYPVFECTHIFHKKGAIFPATVVGKPRQEDYYLGVFLQKLLRPLLRFIMPNVMDLYSYPETGFHPLASCVVKERHKKEAMQQAFRILSEGQLGLTKCLFVLDTPIDLTDFRAVLEALLERIDFREDVVIFSNCPFDTLDYNTKNLNVGSKLVLFGNGPIKRKLANDLEKMPPCILRASLFCKGCLVVELKENTPLDLLYNLNDFMMIVIVDDVQKCVQSQENFLWTVFTRIDPAMDVHLQIEKQMHHKLYYSHPIVLDARMKPYLPKVVEASQSIEQKVKENWENYFETPQQKGDANKAHVY
jgi:UbiD family decarboxylase